MSCLPTGDQLMYQLRNYLEMMTDENRMRPLDAAIRSVVRPGDVVLDLGAGTGVLTFIALDAGAAHVYAIERSPAIEVAERVARANGLVDRITFIEADARVITPPGQVDGMVGDVRGALPLLGDNIDLFEQVRARWVKAGGFTIPMADEIHVAPVATAAAYQSVEGWRRFRREARYDDAAQVAANILVRTNLSREDVLADDKILGTIHYDRATPGKLAMQDSFTITQPGLMTGLGLWFNAELTPSIAFDTSPASPPTVYGQGFLPLSEARAVSPGQTINLTLAVHRTRPELTWTWRVAAAGPLGWTEDHSTFKGTLLGLSVLDWISGTKKPSISDEGRAAQHVLAAMKGQMTARELAADLSAAFPGRFGSPDEALSTVADLLARFAAS